MPERKDAWIKGESIESRSRYESNYEQKCKCK